MSTHPNTIEDFWSRVDKTGECWLWMRGTTRNGYGKFCYQGRSRYAHRLSFVLAFGPIPDGMSVLHRCDNPPCCRPEHLFLGTQADNVSDMVAKGRRYPLELHCPRGDEHYSRREPERLVRGDQHPLRLDSTRVQGERNGQAKLTEAQVRVIAARCDAPGAVKAAIAREFDVSRDIVSAIAHRKKWRHIW